MLTIKRILVLRLFHGRTDPGEALDDWGRDGPWFDCGDYCHTTYAQDIKFGAELELAIVSGMVYYDGCYYGDWSVFMADPDDPAVKQRLVAFDGFKAEVPESPEGE